MNKPLVYYSVSLFIGCLSSQTFSNNFIWGAVLSASFLVVFFITLNRKHFLICTAFFAAGILSFLLYFNAGPLVKEGNLSCNVRIMEQKQFYTLAKYKGKKLILKGNTSKISEGSKVCVYGDFKKDKNVYNGIIGTMDVKKSTLEKEDFIYKMYEFKSDIYKKFQKKLGKDNAAEIMSLCFGDTSYLEASQKEEYKELGVIHAISVSGFHMALIYKILESTAGFKGAVPIAFLYAVFTGAQPATLRAFIMIVVLKLSKYVYRNYDGISSLSLSSIILLVAKPYYVSDLGFILSYLSTLGILLYYDKLQKLFFRLPKFINESISMALSAQCFSLPYVAMSLQYFSIGFILSNLILMPMYCILVVLGNAAAISIKAVPIFDAANYLINTIMLAVKGANYVLLSLNPKGVYLSYTDGIALLALLFCLMLVNKGHKKWRWFPAFILIIVVFQNYYIFPEISCVKINNVQGVLMKYKNESVLVLQKKSNGNMDELKKRYNIDKIYENMADDYAVNLGGKYKLDLQPSGTKNLQLKIYTKEGRQVLSQNISDSYVKDYDKYGIIGIEAFNVVSDAKPLSYWNFKRYKIVFGRAFILS